MNDILGAFTYGACSIKVYTKHDVHESWRKLYSDVLYAIKIGGRIKTKMKTTIQQNHNDFEIKKKKHLKKNRLINVRLRYYN